MIWLSSNDMYAFFRAFRQKDDGLRSCYLEFLRAAGNIAFIIGYRTLIRLRHKYRADNKIRRRWVTGYGNIPDGTDAQ